ncbi:MAG: divergent polysaccharide deacetylase family protein [Pseudolabrys sp.]|nr:divergent polysaccharide deacetylase family protein [Pseudolabrys sp.]
MIRRTSAAAPDLDTPLGAGKKTKRLALPLAGPQIAATALGLTVLIVGLWAVFGNDPYGGEPTAIVATKLGKGAAEQQTTAPAVNGDAGAARIAAAPADAASPPGSKTINIIDGSSGQSRQVVLPSGDGKAVAAAEAKMARAAAEPKLLEETRHGKIPKIGPAGERPAITYARPIVPPAGKADAPRIALIIGGLGISANATAEALAKLPAPVSLAFAPYGADVAQLATRALSEDHEVLLQTPMEPFDYPDNDPGPQTLLTTLSPEQNIDRLHWLMSRMQGYVGLAGFMGTRFTASEAALGPVLREAGKRGLIFVDDGGAPRSVASQVAGGINLPFAKADVVLDTTPTPTEVDRALKRLEMTAREKGSAVAYASALPATINRIAEWAKKAQERGFVLVPISMIAIKSKSS